MGERGPVPKRTEERRRRNKPAGGEVTKVPAPETPADAPAAGRASAVPAYKRANPKWHPVAKAWFNSLAGSGQSSFYQPSDWATAQLLAESLSRDLRPQHVGFQELRGGGTRPVSRAMPLRGSALSAYLKGMTDLLTTEGARRRAAMEIAAPAPEPAGDGEQGSGGGDGEGGTVTPIDQYKNMLGAS